MKKFLSIIVFALYGFMATAQVSKTVNVTTAGTLSTLLTPTELSTVTNLTVTGNIDARDVLTMRDNMPLLAVLDIGAVNIYEFWGRATCPFYTGTTTYPANEMPQYSFYNANTGVQIGKTNLKTITLPISITSIGDMAFYKCSGLTGSLTLPNSLIKIERSAFYGCTKINAFEVKTDNQNYSVIDGVLFNKDFTELILCPNGKNGNYTIPNSVTKISDYAFSGCNGLKGSLIIPNSVTTIGKGAFYSCIGLGSLTLEWA